MTKIEGLMKEVMETASLEEVVCLLYRECMARVADLALDKGEAWCDMTADGWYEAAKLFASAYRRLRELGL